jgi:hypothetical protein
VESGRAPGTQIEAKTERRKPDHTKMKPSKDLLACLRKQKKRKLFARAEQERESCLALKTEMGKEITTTQLKTQATKTGTQATRNTQIWIITERERTQRHNAKMDCFIELKQDSYNHGGHHPSSLV